MRSFETWLISSPALIFCLLGAVGCEPAAGTLNVAQDLRFPPEVAGQSPQTLSAGQYSANAELNGPVLKLSVKLADGHATEFQLPVPTALPDKANSFTLSSLEAGIDYDVTATIDTDRSFGHEINTSEPCTWTTTVTSCVNFEGAGKQCSEQEITHTGMHLVRYRERTEIRNLHVSLRSPGANAQTLAATFDGTSQSKENIYDRNEACE
jgi:hypothetical protein